MHITRSIHIYFSFQNLKRLSNSEEKIQKGHLNSLFENKWTMPRQQIQKRPKHTQLNKAKHRKPKIKNNNPTKNSAANERHFHNMNCNMA